MWCAFTGAVLYDHEPATTNQAERDGIYKRCAVLMPILDIRRTEAVRMDVTIAQGRTKESE